MGSVGMQGSMSTRWRIPYWCEWVIALAGAVTLLNINVTSAGDPLSGSRAGLSSPGITDSGRIAFYAALAMVGAVLAGAFVVAAFVSPVHRRAAALGIRTFAVVTLAGIAGLLFDYRDGPVRLVELLAYFAVVLGTVRLIAIAVAAPGVEPRAADVVGAREIVSP